MLDRPIRLPARPTIRVTRWLPTRSPTCSTPSGLSGAVFFSVEASAPSGRGSPSRGGARPHGHAGSRARRGVSRRGARVGVGRDRGAARRCCSTPATSSCSPQGDAHTPFPALPACARSPNCPCTSVCRACTAPLPWSSGPAPAGGARRVRLSRLRRATVQPAAGRAAPDARRARRTRGQRGLARAVRPNRGRRVDPEAARWRMCVLARLSELMFVEILRRHLVLARGRGADGWRDFAIPSSGGRSA